MEVVADRRSETGAGRWLLPTVDHKVSLLSSVASGAVSRGHYSSEHKFKGSRTL